MDPSTLLIAAVVLCLASAAQSAVGFGYALFATPLLVWTGVPLPCVISLVATCSMLQSSIGAWRLREATPWRWSAMAATIRVLTVVVGLALLRRLTNMDTGLIRLVIGVVLCLLVAVQAAWRPKPVARMHWGWAGLAFVTSGLLSGTCGMGGPPLVLWSMAHDWSANKTRGFLFAVFAASIPFQLLLMWLTFGPPILHYAGIAIAFLPVVYLGGAIGLPLGNRMPKDKLRRLAYAVLFVIGASAVIPRALEWVR